VSVNGESSHGQSHVFTVHAAAALVDRDIYPAWVERALARPDRTEPDRKDPSLLHALLRIPERDGRVLRVVYNPTVTPWRVVTVHFDPGQRKKL
jgi:hypothetical protein